MILLSGSSNLPLAQEIAEALATPLSEIEISKFPNGEKRVWVKAEMADQDVVVIQSFSDPVDEHIIELALIADACKHLRAKRVIAVVPWFGYSPQDKSFRPGEPISAHVIARIIEAMGVDAFVTVDIHSRDTLKFFSIPTLEISSMPLFIQHFRTQDLTNHVVISVDKGSRERCGEFARALDLPMCLFDKTRDRHSGEVILSHLSGDVVGKVGLAFDDFVSTGSTRISASQILKSMGLAAYYDCITHALLAGESAQKLQDSQIDKIFTSNTYLVPKERQFEKLTVLSIGSLLSDAVNQVINQLPD